MDKHVAEEFARLVEALWPVADNPNGPSIDSSQITQAPVSVCDRQIAQVKCLSDMVAAVSLRLRTERNKYVRINSLPTELLREIFCLVGQNGFDFKANMIIIRTCARWRAVAFGEPSMWTQLLLSSLTTPAYELYERLSDMRPLDITLENFWPNKLGLIETRIRSLHATFPHHECFETSTYNKLYIGNMKTLNLVFADVQKQGLLSSRVFDYAYGLECMTLFGGRFLWNSQLYRNLSELSVAVSGLVYGDDEGEDEDESLDVLWVFGGSPNLRSVELRLYEDPQEDWDPDLDPALSERMQPYGQHTRLDMSQLRSIQLDLPYEYVAHILESILYPVEKLTRFDVTMRSVQVGQTLATLLGGSHVPTELFSGLHELRVYDHLNRGVGFRGVGLHQQDSPSSSYTFALSHQGLYRTAPEPHTSFHFPDLPVQVPRLDHLDHLIFDVPSSPSRVVSLPKQDARSLAALVPSWVPAITRLTFDGCQSILFEALQERIVEAFSAASLMEPSLRVREIAVMCSGRFKGTVSVGDVRGIVPLCRLLAEHGSSIQRLSLSCEVSDSTEMSQDEFFEQIVGLGIPDVRRGADGSPIPT